MQPDNPVVEKPPAAHLSNTGVGNHATDPTAVDGIEQDRRRMNKEERVLNGLELVNQGVIIGAAAAERDKGRSEAIGGYQKQEPPSYSNPGGGGGGSGNAGQGGVAGASGGGGGGGKSEAAADTDCCACC